MNKINLNELSMNEYASKAKLAELEEHTGNTFYYY